MPPRSRTTTKAAEPEQPEPRESSEHTLLMEPPVSYDPNDWPPVNVALTFAMREITAIAKNRRVTEGPARFQFRGIDDVLDAVHGPLSRWGLAFVPIGVDVIDNSVGTTRSGNPQQHLLVQVHYAIVGPRGDSITGAVIAESQDTSDKAASKAMSMAYKYFAFQVLSIPVEGLDESDSESTERAAPNPGGRRAAAGPKITHDEVWERIETARAALGKSLEEVTEKFRTKVGGNKGPISVEDMQALPVEAVFPFARQLAAFAAESAEQPPSKTNPEDTNANADGDAAAQEGQA